jgi:hypothetical protein
MLQWGLLLGAGCALLWPWCLYLRVKNHHLLFLIQSFLVLSITLLFNPSPIRSRVGNYCWGFFAGNLIEERRVNFTVPHRLSEKLLRLGVGLGLLASVMQFFSTDLPRGGGPLIS